MKAKVLLMGGPMDGSSMEFDREEVEQRHATFNAKGVTTDCIKVVQEKYLPERMSQIAPELPSTVSVRIYAYQLKFTPTGFLATDESGTIEALYSREDYESEFIHTREILENWATAGCSLSKPTSADISPAYLLRKGILASIVLDVAKQCMVRMDELCGLLPEKESFRKFVDGIKQSYAKLENLIMGG